MSSSGGLTSRRFTSGSSRWRRCAARGGGGDDEEHEEEERPISGAEERGHADETPRKRVTACARRLGRISYFSTWLVESSPAKS